MIKPFIFFIFFTSHFVFSQDIAGNYSPVESKCKLNLKINDDNTFTFSVGKVKNKGFLKVFKDSNVTYLDFTDGISGMYANDTISIQNSGNSMNKYTHFKECNEMYIHLVKKVISIIYTHYCPFRKIFQILLFLVNYLILRK